MVQCGTTNRFAGISEGGLCVCHSEFPQGLLLPVDKVYEKNIFLQAIRWPVNFAEGPIIFIYYYLSVNFRTNVMYSVMVMIDKDAGARKDFGRFSLEVCLCLLVCLFVL